MTTNLTYDQRRRDRIRKGGRYVVVKNVAPLGDETVLARSNDLEAMLRRRDELRDEAVHRSSRRRMVFRVLDEDDEERGEAEWCQSCPAHNPRGTFALDCVVCA